MNNECSSRFCSSASSRASRSRSRSTAFASVARRSFSTSVFVPNQWTTCPSRIPDRIDAREESAKLPVGAAQGKHHLERRSRSDRFLPLFLHRRQARRDRGRAPIPSLPCPRGWCRCRRTTGRCTSRSSRRVAPSMRGWRSNSPARGTGARSRAVRCVTRARSMDSQQRLATRCTSSTSSRRQVRVVAECTAIAATNRPCFRIGTQITARIAVISYEGRSACVILDPPRYPRRRMLRRPASAASTPAPNCRNV